MINILSALHNLIIIAQSVIIEPNKEEEPEELIFKVISSPLLKVELAKLHMKTFVPQGKLLEEHYHFQTAQKNFEFRVKIPSDALYEDLIREDHDSKCGGLVEVIMPRRKKMNKLNFRGSLYLHLETDVTTTTELVQRVAMEVEGTPNNTNNTNNNNIV